MLEAFLITQKLLAVVLVGYLLGAVPFAHLAGRLRGVDMFHTGSTRAGAANLFWNVGRRIGLVVLFADAAQVIPGHPSSVAPVNQDVVGHNQDGENAQGQYQLLLPLKELHVLTQPQHHGKGYSHTKS